MTVLVKHYYWLRLALRHAISNIFAFQDTTLIYLVVILEKLYDNLDIIVIIFNRNYSKNVGSVFSIRIFTVFIGQDETCISFFDLFSAVIILFIRSTTRQINRISYNSQIAARESTDESVMICEDESFISKKRTYTTNPKPVRPSWKRNTDCYVTYLSKTMHFCNDRWYMNNNTISWSQRILVICVCVREV